MEAVDTLVLNALALLWEAVEECITVNYETILCSGLY